METCVLERGGLVARARARGPEPNCRAELNLDYDLRVSDPIFNSLDCDPRVVCVRLLAYILDLSMPYYDLVWISHRLKRVISA